MPLRLVVTARIGVPTTTTRVTAGRSTRMSASTGVRMAATRIPVRSAATGAAAGVTTLIARYGVSPTRVVLRAGTTVTASAGSTVIFRPMPGRARVMRYRATMRRTSMRSNDAPSGEFARSRRRSHRGSAVVKRGTQLPVTGSCMFVVTLHRRGLEMMLMFRGELMRSRMRLDTAGTVERHMVDVVDDGPVIHVGDVDTAHVHGRAVVEK